MIAEKTEELGLDDIERLTKEADEAEEAGRYQKAIDILDQVLAIEKRELGPEHADVGGTLDWQGNKVAAKFNYEKKNR